MKSRHKLGTSAIPALASRRQRGGVDPENVESELVGQFLGDWGARPFANRDVGRRIRGAQ